MRSPFDPFFGMEFTVIDPIFSACGDRPSSQRQRFGNRQMFIDVAEVNLSAWYWSCVVRLCAYVMGCAGSF